MTREAHLLQLIADRGPATLAGLLGTGIVPLKVAEAARRLEESGYVSRDRQAVYALTDAGRTALVTGSLPGMRKTGGPDREVERRAGLAASRATSGRRVFRHRRSA